MTMFNEQLSELRDQWEPNRVLTDNQYPDGYREILCVTDNDQGYETVYVIYEDSTGDEPTFTLMRYFPIGGKFQASQELTDSTLDKCLMRVTYAFNERLPK